MELNEERYLRKLMEEHKTFNEANAGKDLPEGFGGTGPFHGTCADLLDTPCRQRLTERVSASLRRAESESKRATQLRELAHLLAENPEMTRILDLIEAVGQ